MARSNNKSRLSAIVDAARNAFIENRGFRRTQMSDVARRLAIAPGTLYLYVSTKEALFEAAVLGTVDRQWAPEKSAPFHARPLPDLIEHVRLSMIAEFDSLPTLSAALASNRCGEEAEFRAVCSELYDVMSRRREIIRLIEACAKDFPEFAAMYFTNGRVRTAEMLIQYLALGESQGHLRLVGDPLMSARHIIETFAFWAIHRHWDPAPMRFDEADVRENAIEFACAPFIPVGQHGRTLT